jgi:hypothetical protein
MEERILDILKSFEMLAQSKPYSLTIYPLAIEYAKKYESDFESMGRPLGGVGASNRALTTYMAKQISMRSKARKLDQIEIHFLHPADTQSQIDKYKDQQIVAATVTAAYPIPVYRLRQST